MLSAEHQESTWEDRTKNGKMQLIGFVRWNFLRNPDK